MLWRLGDMCNQPLRDLSNGEKTLWNIERQNNVNINRLKLWAKRNLPSGSHLRELLLIEKDLLTIDEFLSKMDVWLKLIHLENSFTIPWRRNN
jgi:hypothetical protein